MYTLEEVTRLIPDKFRVYDWSLSPNTKYDHKLRRR